MTSGIGIRLIERHHPPPQWELNAHGRRTYAKPLIMLRKLTGYITGYIPRQNDNHSIGVVNYCYSMGWVATVVVSYPK